VIRRTPQLLHFSSMIDSSEGDELVVGMEFDKELREVR
jgi:hypothetical protein